MAVTAAVSPNSLPQSSTGLFEVNIVLVRSYRRITISSNSSAAVGVDDEYRELFAGTGYQ